MCKHEHKHEHTRMHMNTMHPPPCISQQTHVSVCLLPNAWTIAGEGAEHGTRTHILLAHGRVYRGPMTLLWIIFEVFLCCLMLAGVAVLVSG